MSPQHQYLFTQVSSQGYDSDTVKEQIQQQIKHQGTADLAGAVEAALVQRGMLGPDTNHRFGKLARAKEKSWEMKLMMSYLCLVLMKQPWQGGD